MSKQYKSIVGMATCNSSTYIQECIAFNYLIGFDKIVVVLDRCDDDTEEKIQKLPDEVLQRVDVFHNSPHRPDVGYQHRVYQHIYDKYKGKAEWMAMFDDDEYFYDFRKRKINDMLDTVADDVGQINLPWIKFTHSKQLLPAPPDITRLRHFTHCDHSSPIIEKKVIARLDFIQTTPKDGGWNHSHWVEASGRTVTFDGKESPQDPMYPTCMRINSREQTNTCLAHYTHCSMEDYVRKYRKWAREKKSANARMEWGWNQFLSEESRSTVDNRMDIYADELIELLKKCK
jgi:hypothetical protein